MCIFFFFNDTATTEIYTLSLHDALPISVVLRSTCTACAAARAGGWPREGQGRAGAPSRRHGAAPSAPRSEEHTSELQSRQYLVCRLLLEKKKKYTVHVIDVILPIFVHLF